MVNKAKSKPRSFTINSSFPSLSIDTSFSRLRKRKPSRIDIELLRSGSSNNGVEYYQSNDDPNLYSVYARNKLLEAIYNVLIDTSSESNINYAYEFSKLIEIQWFTYFINKKICPLAIILIMKIMTRLLQIQNYQYRTSFKNNFKMYKLMNANLPKFYRVYQIYHSLLALTFETPINTVPLNANFDPVTLKRLYKSTIQNTNNNTQYNTDSLLVFLKMIKETVRVWVESINKNQDKIDYDQFSNKKTLPQSKTDGSLPSINIIPSVSNSLSPQNLLIQNMHERHDNKDNNSLSINTIKTPLSAVPFTPITPRTPRTPLINLSEKSKKKIDILDLIENEESLFIYQGNYIIYIYIYINYIY